MNTKDFPTIIREQRIKAGYNQTQVSKLLFLARSTYNNFESGKRIPSIEVILRISALYCINPMELIFAIIPNEIKETNPLYTDYLDKEQAAFSPTDFKLISRFHSLTEDEKKVVTNMMELFHKAHCEIR